MTATSKLPTPCKHYGCPALCTTRYCIEHKADEYASLAERGRNRPSAYKRGYDAEWENKKKQHRRNEPLCRSCGAMGQCVDHIVPISEAPHRKLDDSNLQTLCNRCHTRKTLREEGRMKNERTQH
jgi:5-methylcytosine-specific restriction protein A